MLYSLRALANYIQNQLTETEEDTDFNKGFVAAMEDILAQIPEEEKE